MPGRYIVAIGLLIITSGCQQVTQIPKPANTNLTTTDNGNETLIRDFIKQSETDPHTHWLTRYRTAE